MKIEFDRFSFWFCSFLIYLRNFRNIFFSIPSVGTFCDRVRLFKSGSRISTLKSLKICKNMLQRFIRKCSSFSFFIFTSRSSCLHGICICQMGWLRDFDKMLNFLVMYHYLDVLQILESASKFLSLCESVFVTVLLLMYNFQWVLWVDSSWFFGLVFRGFLFFFHFLEKMRLLRSQKMAFL